MIATRILLGCRLMAMPLVLLPLSACQNLYLQDGQWPWPSETDSYALQGESPPAPVRMDSFPLSKDTKVIGQLQAVTSRHEDTLFDIARRYDLGYKEITAANPAVDAWLPGEGTRIVLPTRFILPDAPRKGIVLNIAAMRIFYYPSPKEGETPVVITHPVGIGRENWSTPLGLTKITSKITNPTWIPPASIRREHEEWGDPLPASVPPGPNNPLGAYAMRLARSKYLIHGTNKPDGIGRRVSHGCIQLFPEDIESLFKKVPEGTPVRIVNQPYLAGWDNGVLYLSAHKPLEEQHRSWKGSLKPMVQVVRKSASENGLPVDWDKAKALAQSSYGFPLPITENSPDLEEILAAVHVHPAPPREKTAPRQVPDEVPSSPQTVEGWYVQTGSFKAEKNAQQLAIMLKRLGPPIPAEPVKTGGYHRVLAGPFPSKAEAEANAQRIESSFGTGALVLEPRGI